LSGAILYLAIVAIWAVVLVPRWLRPRSAPPRPVPAPAEPSDATRREDAGPNYDAGPALSVGAEAPGTASDPTADEPMAGADAGDEDVAEEADEQEDGAPSAGPRRTETVKARRRLLTALAALTAIAVALAVMHIDAYWIVIPPSALLAGYLVLLRAFAHIDAERARRTARIRRADAPAREPAASGEPVPAASPAASEPGIGSSPGLPGSPDGAEIIDISARIGDQVYDQYADAANRAVGD
jgi:hypothetical protein